MIPVIIKHQLVRNDETSVNIVRVELPSVPQIGSYIRYWKEEKQLLMTADIINFVINEKNEFVYIEISNLI